LLAKLSVPFAVPDAVGANVTVNEVLLPAAIVAGRERPPTVNAELFVLAPVTVTFAPLAVRVPVAEALLPTTTLPRLKLVGVTASCPAATAPAPDNGMARLGLEAFEVMVTLPLTDPATVGANFTAKVVL
jgi:hypothetical protein